MIFRKPKTDWQAKAERLEKQLALEQQLRIQAQVSSERGWDAYDMLLESYNDLKNGKT